MYYLFTSFSLTLLAIQLLLHFSHPIFQFFPIETRDDYYINWVIREDVYGLQGGSILEGESEYVKRLQYKEYQVTPGVFRDKTEIKETELTKLRDISDVSLPAKIEDITTDIQTQFQTRQDDRVLYDLWNLLVYGTVDITDKNGSVVSNLKYTRNYSGVSTPWSTAATSKPLFDLESIVNTAIETGTSSLFDKNAKMFANTKTINYLKRNANANDMFGRLQGGGNTVNNLGELNEFLADDNLPTFVQYDRGYKTSATASLTKFIPDNYVVIIGYRPDQSKVGGYQMVKNAVSGTKAGSYYLMKDKTDEVPPHIALYQGHNGGAVVNYPSAVRILYVG